MSRHQLIVVAAAALAVFAGPSAATARDGGLATTQLPRGVVPSHYDVAIIPDAATLRFEGHVAIDIDVERPTASLTLNAVDLTFTRVALSGPGADGLGSPRVTLDATAQTAMFNFLRPIPAGAYRLTMDYAGKIGAQAVGLFALDYDSPAGKRRALYTQFENSDARRVIPSWDEPAYKATFTLNATVPTGLTAVSNMPASATTDLGGGRTLIAFPETPKMSTYLLFFGLGEFDRIAGHVGPTQIGVITQKGKAEQGRFALESSAAILAEYNAYFDTPFPLPKLDNIAAPGRSQFFGAMENWGAIFTFEYDILLDPTISTQADRERSFATDAHEMAHQWFGDLVTMAWWDDLWLNEGFASWMQSRTSARLHPEWNTRLEAVGVREAAMDRDALATTHPVVQHVATVQQASQAFDAITYEKGEAVIAMLEAYVGADVWRAGVRRYIKAHAYGNTVTDDLWREVDAASPDRPVTAIAHQFTLQPGVPMITVGEPACRDGATTLVLTQGEYTKDRPEKTPLGWSVPVIARAVGGGAAVRVLVAGGKADLAVPGCAPVIVNAGQSGYYRTLYAPGAFHALTGAYAGIDAIDQLGILSDSWSLGLAGYEPVSDFLALAKSTPIAADPQVWGRIAEVFSDIDDYYRGDDVRRAGFRDFARATLGPEFAAVGWAARPGEAAPASILRNILIETLGQLGDGAVIAEARRRYAARDADPAAMPAAVRKAVLAVVARHADAATWDHLHAAAAAEKSSLVKDLMYQLLASAEDPALAARALELALTDEPGATNSAGMIRQAGILHPDEAYDFAFAHIGEVDARVDESSRSRYFPSLASRSADPAMIGKIRAYAAANLAPDARRDADTAAADVAFRIRVRNERLPALDAWLAKNGRSGA